MRIAQTTANFDEAEINSETKKSICLMNGGDFMWALF